MTTGHTTTPPRDPSRHADRGRHLAAAVATGIGVTILVWLFAVTSPQPSGDEVRLEPLPVSEQTRRNDEETIGDESGPTTSSPTTAWIEWRRSDAPDEHLVLDTLVATPAGFAIASSPAGGTPRLWSSENGQAWSSSPLSEFPFGLIVHRDELIAFRGRSANRLGWTGSRWEETGNMELPGYERTGHMSGRPGLVSGSTGLLAQTVDGEVFWSGDGTRFEQTIEEGDWGEILGSLPNRWCTPPTAGSLDPAPIIATESGFIALVPGRADPYGRWPVCEPDVWASPDGRTWKPATDQSPFGIGAFVYDVAWGDGKFVASGGIGAGRPMVWLSDDSVAWDRMELGSGSGGVELVEVVNGGVGWMLLGEVTGEASTVGWVSADAVCWHRLPDAVQGRVAAIGSDRIVVADRRDADVIWLGVVVGDEPDCTPTGSG